jgi:hypothetical protein
VGEFVDSQDNRYLFIQNRDYRVSQKFTLPLKQDFRVYEVSQEDGLQRLKFPKAPFVESLTVNLAPGDATLMRFQDPAEAPFLIDYVLDK